MNRALDFLDNAILESIATISRFDDIQLARDLGVPRMHILDRLRHLMDCGFVKRQGEGFSLTETGVKEWIPLRNVYQAAVGDKPGEAEYIWDDLYIPQRGWSGD